MKTITMKRRKNAFAITLAPLSVGVMYWFVQTALAVFMGEPTEIPTWLPVLGLIPVIVLAVGALLPTDEI